MANTDVAQLAETRAAMARHRRPSGTVNVSALARDLGIHHSTARMRIAEAEGVPQRFEAIKLPSPLPSIEALIARRLEEGERTIEADDARTLVDVKVNVEGPYGLFVVGDPHLDDPGCDFRLLVKHIDLVKKHPQVLVGHIGDLSNNWVGRLARLYAEQSTSAHEAWMLVEWLLNETDNLFIVLGNHDLWTGAGNPIDWIARHAPGIAEGNGVRMALRQPCGTITRVHARHDFPGHSIYNEMHGPKREVMMGFRDHILVAGHKHVGGDSATVTPDGIVSQLVRVSGYKRSDSYARTLNLKPAHVHQSALIIIDPREPETSRGRAFCAPTVEKGLLILNAMREEYEAANETAAHRG